MKQIFQLAALLVFTGCFPDVNDPGPPELTEISGIISGTLTLRDAPYRVTDTLIVQANETLTIEPAVRLFFADSAMLIVQGQLTAVGDATRVIEFSASNIEWLGIKFLNSSGSQMRFCVVEKVSVIGQDSLQISAIEVYQSTLTLQNCIIRDNHSGFGGGLYCTNSGLTIANNIFRDNFANTFAGAMILDDARAQVINNTFFNNLSFNYGGGAVVVNPVSVEFENNIFYQNSNATGDPRIAFLTGDSTNFSEQYNFLAFGDMNPQFESVSNLHLQVTSPCRNAGNPDPSFRDADGSRNDQGAYGGPQGNW